MKEQEEPRRKWKGETRVELKGHSPAQIWPLISDFSSLNRWFPHVATCYLLEGVSGQPGVIRYCASMDGNQWAKERLLMIDPSDMCFSYEIVDNNAGFKSYVSTVRLYPTDGDDGRCGCRIVWSFVADPVEGLTLEGLLGFFDITAKAMAQRMEEALSRASLRVKG